MQKDRLTNGLRHSQPGKYSQIFMHPNVVSLFHFNSSMLSSRRRSLVHRLRRAVGPLLQDLQRAYAACTATCQRWSDRLPLAAVGLRTFPSAQRAAHLVLQRLVRGFYSNAAAPADSAAVERGSWIGVAHGGNRVEGGQDEPAGDATAKLGSEKARPAQPSRYLPGQEPAQPSGTIVRTPSLRLVHLAPLENSPWAAATDSATATDPMKTVVVAEAAVEAVANEEMENLTGDLSGV
jgi:hypothetical protein